MRTATALLVFALTVPALAQRRSQSDVVRIEPAPSDPKINSRNLTVELGDSTSRNYRPSFALSAWGDECYFRVDLAGEQDSLKGAVVDSFTQSSHPRREITGTNTTHNMYFRPDGDGAFEWEIVLTAPPIGNVLRFRCEHRGLEFLPQPPLPEQIDTLRTPGGRLIGPGSVQRDSTGRIEAYVPDSVEGSLAVYRIGAGGTFTRPDGTVDDYRTGKAFHLYALRSFDAAGDTFFCAVNVTVDRFTITIPPDKYAFGTYPITIDPQFGYTTAGGSVWTIAATDKNQGTVYGNYTASSGDVVDSLGAYAARDGAIGTISCEVGLYTLSSGELSTLTGSVGTFTINSSTAQWWRGLVSNSLSAGTTYGVAFARGTGFEVNLYYDTGSAGDGTTDDGAYPLPATWTEDTDRTFRFSIYAHYTTGGGGPTQTARRSRWMSQ